MLSVVSVLLVALVAVAVSEYPLGEWEMIERSPAGQSVTFTLALKLRNLDVLNELAERLTTPGSPEFRNWRTMEELNEITRPSTTQVRRLLRWLTASGLQTEDHCDFIAVKGSVAEVEAAFQVEFFEFQHVSRRDYQSIHRAVAHPIIPEAFHNLVSFATGITNLPYPSRPLRSRSENVDKYYVVPQTLRAQYGVPSDYVASNPASSQGLVEFGGSAGVSIPDLQVREHFS
jgi:subtilase family serine protease